MPSCGRTFRANTLELERRLRQFLPHERLSVAKALAEFSHHTSRRHRVARAGGAEREENYEPSLQNPPLFQAASTEYFTMDDDEEMLAARGSAASTRGAAAARAGSAAHSEADRGVRAHGADPRRPRAAGGYLCPCCAGAGDRSASSRRSCRGACGSCPGSIGRWWPSRRWMSRRPACATPRTPLWSLLRKRRRGQGRGRGRGVGGGGGGRAADVRRDHRPFRALSLAPQTPLRVLHGWL